MSPHAVDCYPKAPPISLHSVTPPTFRSVAAHSSKAPGNNKAGRDFTSLALDLTNLAAHVGNKGDSGLWGGVVENTEELNPLENNGNPARDGFRQREVQECHICTHCTPQRQLRGSLDIPTSRSGWLERTSKQDRQRMRTTHAAH